MTATEAAMQWFEIVLLLMKELAGLLQGVTVG